MIDELNKIGDINSVNDLFDFKLSIKTIVLLVVAWGFVAAIAVVFMLGGVNNTVDYITDLIESTKKKVILNKNAKQVKTEEKKEEEE
jgi:hypothetical protein